MLALAVAAWPPSAAAHRLTVRLRDAVSGEPAAARVQIVGPAGPLFNAPDPLLRTYHGAGLSPFVLAEDSLLVDVPAGSYQLHAVQGLCGVPVAATVAVAADTAVTMLMARWIDPRADGWIAGDPHVHLQHPPASYAPGTPQDAARAARAERLEVVFLLANDAAHPGGPVAPQPMGVSLAWGEEYRSSYWGHVVLLGLPQLVVSAYGPGCCGADQPAWPSLEAVLAPAQAPVALLAHPHTTDTLVGGFFWPDSGYARELAALAMGPRLQGIAAGSASNGPGHWAVQEYADALAVGARWAAVGESDMTLDRYGTGPPGWPRTFARIVGAPPAGSPELPGLWEQAVAQRRCFATDGPIVRELQIAGHGLGETASLPGPGLVTVLLRAASRTPLRAARLHGVGGLRWSAAWPAGRGAIDTTFALPLGGDDALFLELVADGGAWEAPAETLRAVTSPIQIQMGAPWPVPAAVARRGADGMNHFWKASLLERGYATPQESLQARTYLLGAAAAYEALFDDPSGPFTLMVPAQGATLPTTAALLRWSSAFSYDGEPTSYRVALDHSAAFAAPDWREAGADTFLTVQDLQPGQEVYWKVQASEPGDPVRESAPPAGHFFITTSPVGAPPAPPAEAARAGLSLSPATASRGAGRIALTLELARAGRVRLRWLDLRGRVVVALAPLDLAAGRHELVWDGRDDQGRPVAAGVYWLLAESGTDRAARRALLLRR